MTETPTPDLDLSALDRPRLAAYALACATHLQPLVRGWASPATAAAVDDWLQRLWAGLGAGDGAGVGAVDAAAAEQVDAEVNEADEADADDSNSPAYYAMRAISAISYAATAQYGEDAVEAAGWASDEAVDLLADLDVTLASTPPLAEVEAAAQAEAYALVSADPFDPAQVRAAAEAARIRDVLTAAVPAYAAARGWN
ncbi:hypothetical protein GIS00_15020 [Nakamurella sp. YIM 132087]|uniref:DUF416 family protein n=1 Tax=Nakamurella alba TaxID=2665158 RepID=A0A7K1FM71_9ACTN|nr:hypothetical protein [Nakamurella alba]MTD15252.1 hypothetical protein [Nakamurella alba]